MAYSLLVLSFLYSTSLAQFADFNFNPVPPEHVHSHIFMFGNGSVPVAEGPNPFANNALEGHEFLSQHLLWEEEMIEHRRSVSILNGITYMMSFYHLFGACKTIPPS